MIMSLVAFSHHWMLDSHTKNVSAKPEPLSEQFTPEMKESQDRKYRCFYKQRPCEKRLGPPGCLAALNSDWKKGSLKMTGVNRNLSNFATSYEDAALDEETAALNTSRQIVLAISRRWYSAVYVLVGIELSPASATQAGALAIASLDDPKRYVFLKDVANKVIEIFEEYTDLVSSRDLLEINKTLEANIAEDAKNLPFCVAVSNQFGFLRSSLSHAKINQSSLQESAALSKKALPSASGDPFKKNKNRKDAERRKVAAAAAAAGALKPAAGAIDKPPAPPPVVKLSAEGLPRISGGNPVLIPLK